MASKIRRGDKVIVIAGSNKGQVGLIERVDGDRAFISGVNMMVKHVKPQAGAKGKLELVTGSIHVSNLAHVDQDEKPIKVAFTYDDAGTKFLVNSKDHSQRIRKV